MRRLDVGSDDVRGPGGPFRRHGSGAEYGGRPVVVELRPRQPELRGHGSARRGWTNLLLRRPLIDAQSVTAPPLPPLPTYADVEDAAHRIAGVAHRTPVAVSRTIDL